MRDCSVQGDCLSWGQMQWNLKGPARIEGLKIFQQCWGQMQWNLKGPARIEGLKIFQQWIPADTSAHILGVGLLP